MREFLQNGKISVKVQIILLFFALLGALIGALLLQYVWGLKPCALCLQERWPYGIAVVLLGFLGFSFYGQGKNRALFFVLLLISVLMFYDTILSFYHMGVELHWWKGPASCSSSQVLLPSSTKDLMSQLATDKPVSCDVAPAYFLGLSPAAWNSLYSLLCGLFSLCLAVQWRKEAQDL